ncbi:hypothetical protein EJ07DRAFT_99502 [Lizonia empirigonia]|nr:hypothetical protein EJ07DRAFT_99502 [Lizonia empirigonia]
MSFFLAMPQELRDEILHYLTLPGTVYTSSAKADTFSLHQVGSRKTEETYVDTRIYLPSRPPDNLLATCKQLRQECLEQHTHLLNSFIAVEREESNTKVASSTKLAERSGTEFDEAAERAVDDDVTLRLTLEVQRGQRGPFGGFAMPARRDLSPRFRALLPFMWTVRRLKLIIWPGFDWWNGPPQVSPLAETAGTDVVAETKLDAVVVAVRKVLDQLPAIEELDLSIFIATGDLFRWDLPDVKWEKIQPWLDGPITKSGGLKLRKVSRTLTSVWQMPEVISASYQPFYVQKETRSDTSTNRWHVERQGGLRAVSGARWLLVCALTEVAAYV